MPLLARILKALPVRFILYLYVLLVACPIRYWPLEHGWDPTWRFALNYGAARGLTPGVEIIFTAGPLGYLTFPQDVGANLAYGLLFQAGLWLVLGAMLSDVFFRAGFRLWNLTLFSVCFGMATPLFRYNGFGVENLVLAGALMLMVMFHLRGSWVRYLVALALIGLLPMLKLTSGVVGAAALAGFLLESATSRRRRVLRAALLALVIPGAIAITLGLMFTRSVPALAIFLRSSLEIMSGFSSAMSLGGPPLDLVSAIEALVVLITMLCFLARQNPGAARFYVFLLALPLLISFKNGFVRQDVHTLNFFCFLSFALALILLTASIDRETGRRVMPLMIVFFIIWQDSVVGLQPRFILESVSGVSSARSLWWAIPLDRQRRKLNSALLSFPENVRLEPELVRLIGDSAVASLSSSYTNLPLAGLRVALAPVLQRYAAYTPYLDRMNAAWVRDRGPRFLVFDGEAIDSRDPWAETPAMWLEVYRWYDTRILGPRNLLLERRSASRFASLETLTRFRATMPSSLKLPASPGEVFWTMKCDYSLRGRLLKLLFRVPASFMTVEDGKGGSRRARIIPDLFVSPVMGNSLPGSLAGFASVFQPDGKAETAVDKITFEGPGFAAYSHSCEVEFLRPVL